jgi:hypothetical protein
LLTPIQERIAEVVRTLPEAEPFALAGGAALILQGRTSRVTEDLDFFARSPAEVDALLPRLEDALVMPAENSPLGPIPSGKELAADKVPAVQAKCRLGTTTGKIGSSRWQKKH